MPAEPARRWLLLAVPLLAAAGEAAAPDLELLEFLGSFEPGDEQVVEMMVDEETGEAVALSGTGEDEEGAP